MFTEEKTHPPQQHLEHSSETKKCSHEADDILWRETVSHQKFITTSPHSFLPDTESSTATPLSDISPFLLPPTISHTGDQAVSSPPRTRNKEDRRKKGETRQGCGIFQDILTLFFGTAFLNILVFFGSNAHVILEQE